MLKRQFGESCCYRFLHSTRALSKTSSSSSTSSEQSEEKEFFLLISISCNVIDVLEAKWNKIKAKIWMSKPNVVKARRGWSRANCVTLYEPIESSDSRPREKKRFLGYSLSFYPSTFDDNFISYFVLCNFINSLAGIEFTRRDIRIFKLTRVLTARVLRIIQSRMQMMLEALL